MKWFWQKKPNELSKSDHAATFRENVDTFWQWWSANSTRILEAIDEDRGTKIQPEISAAVDTLGASFGWVFGPPAEGKSGHSFTLTPEGCSSRRYLARYWLDHAPELDGWTFYASRQPSEEIGGFVIQCDDVEVSVESIWVTPVTDESKQVIDITAWSPTFAEIGNEHAMRILFLLLDESLGEAGTERCLGIIEIGDGKLDRSIPLRELAQHVLDEFAKHEWRMLDTPWSNYQVNERLGEFPRGDVYVGSTENWNLVRDWLDEAGPIEDPIADSGAEFVFLQMALSHFSEGEEVDQRGKIMDALDSRLLPDLGRVTGGATGTDAVYIDLLLFDGQSSRTTIAEVMATFPIGDEFQIFPFTKT